MLATKNPIKRVTILSPNGISMYHRSFVKGEDFDEQLFSGFTSAMLAFIKEMGNELNSLSMKGMNLYFQQKPEYITVLGVDSDFINEPAIQQVFDGISGLSQVNDMVTKVSYGVFDVVPELETGIIDIISAISSEKIILEKEEKDQKTENNEIQQLINQYLNGSINAKQTAMDLIGKDIEDHVADKKLEATNMIKDMVNSTSIEKDTRKKLDGLLKEMKKSSTKAAAKVNKALF